MQQVVESAPAAKRGRAALVQTHECAPVLVQTPSVKRKRDRGFRVKNTPRFKFAFAREYKCKHGKRRRDCRQCRGSSLCTHGTPKTRFLSVVYGPVCGPVLLLRESVCVLVCACASVHIVCVGAPPSGSLSLSLSLALSLSLSWKTGASCGWAPHRDVRVNGATHARGEILPRRHSTQTFSCISRTVDGQPGTRAHKIPCLMKKSSTVRLPNAKRSPGRPTRGSSH